jgi:anionic cell wall polymer biosynthesis LytR-Cps2A-Psr (LCP) family protein
MGLFSIILLIVVVLAIVGLGWKIFSSGVLSGFEKVINVGQPLVKNLTDQAKKYVNSPTTGITN